MVIDRESAQNTMSMMEMPRRCAPKAWVLCLRCQQTRRLGDRKGVHEFRGTQRARWSVLTIMDGSQPGCIFQTEQLSYSLEQPIKAAAASLSAAERRGGDYWSGFPLPQGSDRFIPARPTLRRCAQGAGRDPQSAADGKGGGGGVPSP